MYKELSIAIIIKPLKDKSGLTVDNWLLEPPFINDPLSAGHKGYIIANTKEVAVGFSDYLLLETRFLNLGQIINDIDFIAKINEETSEESVSNGLGGYAKLKDFTVNLTDFKDVINNRLFGREIEIRTYEGSILTNDSENKYSIDFRGLIYNIDRSIPMQLSLVAQGLSSNNNARISGEPYVDPNGNTVNTFIIIGQIDQDTLVKLDKKKSSQGVQLGFNDKKYKLKKLYVKDSDADEFYPVQSEFSVSKGLVSFVATESIRLVNNISETNTSFRVNDPTLIKIKFLSVAYNYNYVCFRGKKSGRTKWLKNRGVTTEEKEEGIYKTTASFLNPETLNEVLNWHKTDEIWISPVLDLTHPDAEKLDHYHVRTIDVYKEPYLSFENEIAYGYLLNRKTADDLSGNEYSILDSPYTKWDLFYYSGNMINKTLDCVGFYREKTPMAILKIKNEEIAVLDIIDYLDYKIVLTVRGYNGTKVESHTTDDEVQVQNSEASFFPVVRVKKDAAWVDRDSGAPLNIDFSNQYREWLEGKPYKWHFKISPWEKNQYLFFEFNLPNFSGAIVAGNPVLDYALKLEYLHEDETVSLARVTFYVTLARGMNTEFLAINSAKVGQNQVREQFINSNSCIGCRVTDGRPWKFHNNKDTPTNNPSIAQYIGGGCVAIPHLWNDDQLEPDVRNVSLIVYSATNGYNNFEIKDLPEKSKFYVRGTSSMSQQQQAKWMTNPYRSAAVKYFYWDNDEKYSITRFINYSDLVSTRFALKLNKYSYDTGFSRGIFNLSKLRIDLKTKVPIKENEWYGQMEILGTDFDLDGIVGIVTLGTNGSIYLMEKDKKNYLFGASDQRPLIVYQLADTGLLIKLDEILLTAQPTMASGYLAIVEEDNNDELVSAVKNTAAGFDYISSKPIDDSGFPELVDVKKMVSKIKKTNVGSDRFETKSHVIVYDPTSGFVRVFLKKAIKTGNPIDVLKTILVTYGKYSVSMIDDNPSDSFDENFSFGKIRKKYKDLKLQSTVIIEEEINSNNIISEFCENFGLVLYESNQGILRLADLYPPEPDDSGYLSTLNLSDIQYDDNLMPDFTEEVIDLKFLYTSMNLRYSPFEGKYQKEIKNEDWASVDSNVFNLLENSKKYTYNDCEIALNLKFTRDKKTALYCAYLKMLFHSRPSRFINVTVIPEWVTTDLGKWFTIQENDFIPKTKDKQYMLLNITCQQPISRQRPFVTLKLLEFDWSSRDQYIQEVYEEDMNQSYQEVYEDTEIIQEI